jgi:stage II sporulation protein D
VKRALGLLLLLVAPIVGGSSGSSAKGTPAASAGFPQTVRVRLWHLHPPRELRLKADSGRAQFRKCATCKSANVTSLNLRAVGSRVQIAGVPGVATDVHINGVYQITAAEGPPIGGDFPIEVHASEGHLRITAVMPMEEYIAGVLAGEAGNFKSDEALKAIGVAARTFAIHFGSRHAQDGFDFCDTTHCQDLRATGINDHLRRIAESTAGEILWYDGEPAATYYHANCGGTTEDGRYLMGNDEAPAPFLRQHSDQYCLRNGGSQWHTEVTTRELQRALVADGINIPGKLRSVMVQHRTPSGRVEFLRVSGSASITVPGPVFRFAVGRHIGWERLKSNWYDVSNAGDHIVFNGRGSGHGVGLCQVGAEAMGEEGHSYRDILSFYYPGTRLGVNAQAVAWQRLGNENLELLTTRPERDRALLPLATGILHQAEQSTGLIYRDNPRLKVYSTVAAFRNSTGEPGWVAASTRGRTIQLQPPDVLQQAGTLDGTLRHELLHMLIESHARPGTPLWFREGLVLYLSEPNVEVRAEDASLDTAALEKTMRSPASEEQLRQAYAEAHARVAQLAREHGKETLLRWVKNGLPAEALATRGVQTAR